MAAPSSLSDIFKQSFFPRNNIAEKNSGFKLQLNSSTVASGEIYDVETIRTIGLVFYP